MADSNGDTPAFPHVSCDNAPNGDMFMNYMDYVDDAAMFMFSQGQANRMDAALSGPRRALARSKGLAPVASEHHLVAFSQEAARGGPAAR